MELFEGFVGIRLWDGQRVDDVIFALLLGLFVLFAVMFHLHFHLFVKMLNGAFLLKERQTRSEKPVGSERLFRLFMTFQTLLLATLALFLAAQSRGYFSHAKEGTELMLIGSVFLLLLLFYQSKQFLYKLFGSVFAEPTRYRFWRYNYHAVFGTWGVFLYLPVLWMVGVESQMRSAILMFVISYILCRFVIIYKLTRIFYQKNADYLYISLYLCGQEILPLFFLYKGVFYLYNIIETSTLLWH